MDIQETIKQHKQLARLIADKKYTLKDNEKAIHKYIITGEKIALVLSKFKCENEKCKAKEKLTLHHLVKRDNRKYVPPNKYLVQRHYFFSITVLCSECHNKLNGVEYVDSKTISQRKIKKLKKDYGLK